MRNDLENILKGLSVFVLGSADMYKEIDGATLHELREALELSLNSYPRRIFRLCRLSRERGKNGGDTKVTGNETMLGQVATFMESLGLSYEDVVYKIPYRNF